MPVGRRARHGHAPTRSISPSLNPLSAPCASPPHPEPARHAPCLAQAPPPSTSSPDFRACAASVRHRPRLPGPSPTSHSSSLAPPGPRLSSTYLADPIPSPEPPRCCHPRRTPHGHLAIINRAIPAPSPPHQTCSPPSPRSPRPISPLKSSPELANCSVDRRNPTQKPSSIDASPSDATGTSALLIIDNTVLHRR